MIRAWWLTAVAVMANAVVVAAEPIDRGPASIELTDDWHGDPPSAGDLVRIAGDATLLVTRFDVPNLTAWRDSTRAAYIDAIVAGFATAPGYALSDRTVQRMGPAGVPTLDLHFRRRGPRGREVVAVRVLLFRTLTMVAVAAAASDRTMIDRAVAGLVPD
jgi:hypothetical protein